MNRYQRSALCIYAITIALICTYVPWKAPVAGGRSILLGYGFVWSGPAEDSGPGRFAEPALARIGLKVCAVSVLFGVAFLLLPKPPAEHLPETPNSERTPGNSESHRSQDVSRNSSVTQQASEVYAPTSSLISRSGEPGMAAAKEMEKGPSGIGGWLILFFLSLMIGQPVAAFNELSQVKITILLYDLDSPTQTWLLSLAYAQLVIAVAGTASVVWMLSRHRSSITVIRTYLIALLAFRTILGIIFWLKFSSTASATKSLVGVLIVSAWILYFMHSRRVRNTYGRNL